MYNKHFIHKAFYIFVVNSILSSAAVVACTIVDAIILGNAFCERLSIDKKMAYYINLTIEELASNIISFGFNDGKRHSKIIKEI